MRRRERRQQADLFSVNLGATLMTRLDGLTWPDQRAFPVNRASTRVRDPVWSDLVNSPNPLMVVGYASIGEVVLAVSDWVEHHHNGQVRITFGSEPFISATLPFGDPEQHFTEQARAYWHDRGFSLRQSLELVSAVEAIRQNRVAARFVHGTTSMHAKVYVGTDAATMGSSNFTANGLRNQVEANARFDRSTDPERFDDVERVAENLWEVGQDWTAELLALLESLLRQVGWQEALARACSDLLEGEWAANYLIDHSGPGHLWPTQRVGIAQAMWIIENVGSVLVADATGSGKTRMGAHLVRAVRDRLWSTGRVRRDLTVLVCPPSVEATWKTEAISCGLAIETVSHGKLSRAERTATGHSREVRQAQLLAVDEAHNFLNPSSNRTRYLKENLADHVMLFTATPINKGAADLLDLVGLLGPDNFDDATLAILNQLDRRGRLSRTLHTDQLDVLKAEIQKFTLRRTKAQINRLVERNPADYVHPTTGEVCRYPNHLPRSYRTGETETDIEAAKGIRAETEGLLGIALLRESLRVPVSMRSFFTDEQWLAFRLQAVRGLATHNVLGALRSSRAALLEHLRGTEAAVSRYAIRAAFKEGETGNAISRLHQLAEAPPPAVDLDSAPPGWLSDEDQWRAACHGELEHYEAIERLLETMSDARERQKADLLADLATRHERVLAFDRHLITLAVLKDMLEDGPVASEVLIATGQARGERRKVEAIFAPTAQGSAIALCSDAMNEGLNLQGASTIVHLDLPTTLRVAEQRVGRVDRMDSPHDEIEAWWPLDGDAFATRANERLAERVAESEALLGSNLPVPDLHEQARSISASTDHVVRPKELQDELERAKDLPWDGLSDALEPVRSLVEGDNALIDSDLYEQYRLMNEPVLARVSLVRSDHLWAFLSVRSTSQGAPRWLWVAPSEAAPVVTELKEIGDRLRQHLAADPPSHALDRAGSEALGRCLDKAADVEAALMPRRMRRAHEQMHIVFEAWAVAAQRAGDEVRAARWRRLRDTTLDSDQPPELDPFGLAERWLQLIAPVLEAHRVEQRNLRYVLLRDITPRLTADPFDLDVVEAAFVDVPAALPLADRVSACILGVPG